ncbi:oxidoreductase [Streptomyces sp. NPDC087844]|uniref:oxidoreductase n=1 Tax=Streptomyces sp. NPDC087844 TaxID=3365805 RepID=UPI0037FFEDF0
MTTFKRSPDSWTPADVPDQTGRTFVVTGGNAGIGYFISEHLARAGAHVVIASRNAKKAAAAQSAIRHEVPGASLGYLHLDLNSIDEVRKAADDLARLPRIDALIENAGVMSPPSKGERTADGHELIMGVSHLGNFALTALALPVLQLTPGSRIVTTSSMMAKRFNTPVDDLESPARNAVLAYARAKSAVELFSYELDRRLRAARSPVKAVITHPGMGHDSLSPNRPGVHVHRRFERLKEPLFALVGQGKDLSAWSAVRAATDPAVEGGQYWGPHKRVTGMPSLVEGAARNRDQATGERLWADSERLTGVTFRVPDAAHTDATS